MQVFSLNSINSFSIFVLSLQQMNKRSSTSFSLNVENTWKIFQCGKFSQNNYLTHHIFVQSASSYFPHYFRMLVLAWRKLLPTILFKKQERGTPLKLVALLWSSFLKKYVIWFCTLEALLHLVHSHWLHLFVEFRNSLMPVNACKSEFPKKFRNPNPTETLSQQYHQESLL